MLYFLDFRQYNYLLLTLKENKSNISENNVCLPPNSFYICSRKLRIPIAFELQFFTYIFFAATQHFGEVAQLVRASDS